MNVGLSIFCWEVLVADFSLMILLIPPFNLFLFYLPFYLFLFCFTFLFFFSCLGRNDGPFCFLFLRPEIITEDYRYCMVVSADKTFCDRSLTMHASRFLQTLYVSCCLFARGAVESASVLEPLYFDLCQFDQDYVMLL